jgi:hypothetical protein
MEVEKELDKKESYDNTEENKILIKKQWSKEQKRIGLEKVLEFKSYYKASQITGIPETNLRRWDEELKKDPENFGIDKRAGNVGRKV